MPEKINLLTDAPRHNLALMKLSTWHKCLGDIVALNQPLMPHSISYGSWLFSFKAHPPADIEGGPGFNPQVRLTLPDDVKPDYDLFPTDYSLGYTWEYCPRQCAFCCVPQQNNPRVHHSIWEFHESRFKKICLLNNNTFSDPQWRETFEEIWDANLTVRDENGYDLRLLNDERAEALAKTRFEKQIHFAWDQMQNEKAILAGLKLAQRYKLNAMVFVLIGFNTTEEEDIYRCQKITDMGFTPYVMPYRSKDCPKPSRRQIHFKRCIDYRYYGKTSIAEAWRNYKG